MESMESASADLSWLVNVPESLRDMIKGKMAEIIKQEKETVEEEYKDAIGKMEEALTTKEEALEEEKAAKAELTEQVFMLKDRVEDEAQEAQLLTEQVDALRDIILEKNRRIESLGERLGEAPDLEPRAPSSIWIHAPPPSKKPQACCFTTCVMRDKTLLTICKVPAHWVVGPTAAS